MPPKPDQPEDRAPGEKAPEDKSLAELTFRELVLRVEGGTPNYAELSRRSGGRPSWQRWQQLCDKAFEGDATKYGMSAAVLQGVSKALGVSEGVVWSCLGVSRGIETLSSARGEAIALLPHDITETEARWLAGILRTARKGPGGPSPA